MKKPGVKHLVTLSLFKPSHPFTIVNFRRFTVLAVAEERRKGDEQVLCDAGGDNRNRKDDPPQHLHRRRGQLLKDLYHEIFSTLRLKNRLQRSVLKEIFLILALKSILSAEHGGYFREKLLDITYFIFHGRNFT
jgi:hypothetical protein